MSRPPIAMALALLATLAGCRGDGGTADEPPLEIEITVERPVDSPAVERMPAETGGSERP